MCSKPRLFTLFPHDCVTKYQSNPIITFADDITIVGRITNIDEVAYRDEVQQLKDWCKDNKLILKVSKTKEMVVNIRKTIYTLTYISMDHL